MNGVQPQESIVTSFTPYDFHTKYHNLCTEIDTRYIKMGDEITTRLEED